MALGPKEMGEAIIRNLKLKTGKDLYEWMALLEQLDIKERKAALAYLREKKGLGFFQSQKVVERYFIKEA